MVASTQRAPSSPFVRLPSERGAFLEARNLVKTYADPRGERHRAVRAVDDVSLRLRRGEVVALVGESGCGKSTVGRLLLGLETPDSGALSLEGAAVTVRGRSRVSLDFRRRVQMVLQDPFASLNPVHTVGHHVSRPLRRHGLATRETCMQEVHALLRSVGLSPPEELAAAHPHALSGGQRQRVAIARALATRPEVIVADEPTSMLDVSLRLDILNLLLSLRDERGVSMLLITHDLASARYVGDRVVVLYAGRIVEEGPMGHVMLRPAHPYTELLIRCVPHVGQRLAASWAPRASKHEADASAWACPFGPRCPRSLPQCRHTTPTLSAVDAERRVACHNVAATYRFSGRLSRSHEESVTLGGLGHA